MDQLKHLSIPSKLLRFFNQFSFPYKGRPTRSMHPPHGHTQHTTYECGQKQVPKTMNQLKRLSIPSEMLRFLNHACPPRMGHPTRSVHSAPHEHTQHALVNAFPTSSLWSCHGEWEFGHCKFYKIYHKRLNTINMNTFYIQKKTWNYLKIEYLLSLGLRPLFSNLTHKNS